MRILNKVISGAVASNELYDGVIKLNDGSVVLTILELCDILPHLNWYLPHIILSNIRYGRTNPWD